MLEVSVEVSFLKGGKRVVRLRNLYSLLIFVFGILSSESFSETQKVYAPEPWQIGLQSPGSNSAVMMHDFYNLLLVIIIFIALFVSALLIYVSVRFREEKNPIPSKVTHHTGLEIVWTLIPALILVVIAIPSFRLLRHQIELPKEDLLIKATGHQWYWSYAYPNLSEGSIQFDSTLIPEDKLKPGDVRLLSVDNEMVVPVGKVVRLQLTASDVIHAFALPALGLKMDAIPGRLNETWFKPDKEGLYYGQCSIICGQNHAYMPIAVRVVSQEAYDQWVRKARETFS